MLRQRASALRSLVVDANTPVWVHQATETVLDLAIGRVSDSIAGRRLQTLILRTALEVIDQRT